MMIQFIRADISHAIGWTLIHSLWQVLLIALLLQVFLQFNKSKSSTNKRYVASILAIGAVLLTSVVTFVLQYEPVTALSATEPAVVGQSFVASAFEVSTSTRETMLTFLHSNLDNITIFYSLGVVLFLLRTLVGFGYINYLKSSAVNIEDDRTIKILGKCMYHLGMKQEMGLKESKSIDTPMVVGWVSPIILFPIGVINSLSTEEVKAILLHELAHIKRKDHYWKALQAAMEVMFFYHPAFWWISKQANIERENCCDDIAIANGISPLIYSKTLVKLEEYQLRKPALALTFFNDKRQLLNRVKRILIMDTTKRHFNFKTLMTTICLVSALLVSTHLISNKSLFNNKSEAVESIESITPRLSQAEPNFAPQLYFVPQDTTPTVKKTQMKVIVEKNGENIEIEKEDGKITEMKVNGRVLPESEYGQYEDVTGDIQIHTFETDRFPGDFDFGEFFSDSTILNSQKFLLDEEGWRSFGGDIRQIFPEDMFEGLNFDFDIEEGEDGQIRIFGLNKMDSLTRNMEDYVKELEKTMESEELKMKLQELENMTEQWDFNSEELEEMVEKLTENMEGQRFFFPQGEEQEFRFERGSKKVSDVLGNNLNKDGLLLPNKMNKVELNHKHLKINGEKQPSNFWDKYKRIYEQETGLSLTKGTKIVFQMEGKESKRKLKAF